ncbi:MAG: AAA family ATPase [Chloroflexota bacterium]
MLVCSHCGQENPPGAGFCNACGGLLSDQRAAGVLKTVTVLFCDMVGSTSLGDCADPELLREAMSRYHAELRAAIERNGGTVEKFIGDAVMALFGLPQTHEDDALRAARAALEARAAVQALGLQVRIGINTGEVFAGGGETLVTGDAVNVAARLEQAAGPGEVLIGEATESLVRGLIRAEPIEPLTLRGKAEPVRAHRLLEVDPGGSSFARRDEGAFVGRERELETLRSLLTTTTVERSPRLATIMGPPGIGKSRLVRELVRRADARVLIGRCLSYGQGITYWPLAEIVAQVGNVDAALGGDQAAEFAAARIAAALGTGGATASSEEIAWAFRRLFETLAQAGPLIVVLNDIHWAEPTLLDLVEYISTFARDAGLLLLCTGRPELLDARPGWAALGPNATMIALKPLARAETVALVEELGGSSVETQAIVEAANGNPFFVEQLIAHKAESAGRAPKIPPTIQAVLAARIDGLEPEERAVIERASVEGRVFHLSSVRELLPESARPGLGGHLLSLVRKEFIRPDRAQLPGDDAFRFDHTLIRDAAYESIPKRVRGDLHERVADWLESRLGEDAPREILAYHLEQAHRYRVELLLQDGHTDALALRVGRLLGEAGRKAHARGDDAATRALLERAARLLPEADPLVPELLAVLGSSIYQAGDAQLALEYLRRAQSVAAPTEQRGVWLRARMDELAILVRIDPTQGTEGALLEAKEAIAELERLGDAESLARAWRAVIEIGFVRSNFALVGEASSQLLECATTADIRRDAVWAVRGLAAALAYGTTPVEEAIVRAEQGLARFPQEGAGEDHLAELYAFAGRHEDAGRAIERSRQRSLELGQKIEHAYASQEHGWIALLVGSPERVEPDLRASAQMLEEAGESSGLAGVAVVLAAVLYRLARFDESEAWLERAKRAIQPEDVLGQADWRALQAKLLARTGRAEEALRLSGEAIDLARRTDGLPFLGDYLFSRAEVLLLLGQEEAARPVLEEALAVYQRKGIIPSIARTRALLAQPGAAV